MRWGLPVSQTSVRRTCIVIRELDALDVTNTLRMDLDDTVFTELLYTKRVGVWKKAGIRSFLDIVANFENERSAVKTHDNKCISFVFAGQLRSPDVGSVLRQRRLNKIQNLQRVPGGAE